MGFVHIKNLSYWAKRRRITKTHGVYILKTCVN